MGRGGRHRKKKLQKDNNHNDRVSTTTSAEGAQEEEEVVVTFSNTTTTTTSTTTRSVIINNNNKEEIVRLTSSSSTSSGGGGRGVENVPVDNVAVYWKSTSSSSSPSSLQLLSNPTTAAAVTGSSTITTTTPPPTNTTNAPVHNDKDNDDCDDENDDSSSSSSKRCCGTTAAQPIPLPFSIQDFELLSESGRQQQQQFSVLMGTASSRQNKTKKNMNNDRDILMALWHGWCIQGGHTRMANRSATTPQKGRKRRIDQHHDAAAVDDVSSSHCCFPTPIQLYSWPILVLLQPNTTTTLAQHQQPQQSRTTLPPHLIQIAPTGSGKTYAYGFPLLIEALNNDTGGGRGITSIVLVPTRELARQVQLALEDVVECNHILQQKIAIVSLYGGGGYGGQQQQQRTSSGSSKQAQLSMIRNTVVESDKSLIIAATTGRLLDILQTKDDDGDDVPMLFDSKLQSIVLDEADRLATNKDLFEQTNAIFDILQQRQQQHPRIILCSATWPDRITPMWDTWIQNDPCIVVQVDTMSINRNSDNKTSSLQQHQQQHGVASASQSSVTDPTLASSVKMSVNNQLELLSSIDDDNNINSNEDRDVSILQKAETTRRTSLEDQQQLQESPNYDGKNNTIDHHPTATTTTTTTTRSLQLSRIPQHIVQIVHVCAEHKKPKKLVSTLQTIHQQQNNHDNNNDNDDATRRRPCSIIVFFAKIKTLQYMASLLHRENSNKKKWKCIELHSHLQPHDRERSYQEFISSNSRSTSSSTTMNMTILLATDIAARGLHIPHIQYIINYDFPTNLEQYVHRCGRTGRSQPQQQRSGTTSTVYSFFTRNLAPLATNLITLLEMTNQWIDPNLRALVVGSSSNEKRPKSLAQEDHRAAGMPANRSRNKNSSNEDNDDDSHMDDDDGDDDPFPQLSAKRIVLKRALNVSDASSSSSDDHDE